MRDYIALCCLSLLFKILNYIIPILPSQTSSLRLPSPNTSSKTTTIPHLLLSFLFTSLPFHSLSKSDTADMRYPIPDTLELLHDLRTSKLAVFCKDMDILTRQALVLLRSCLQHSATLSSSSLASSSLGSPALDPQQAQAAAEKEWRERIGEWVLAVEEGLGGGAHGAGP